MRLQRRTFLKLTVAGTATAVAAAPATAAAATRGGARADAVGVLVDATRCVGCRACEAACSETNHLAAPTDAADVFESRRTTGPGAFTVVNRATGDAAGERFAKTQCLHCVEPACATACPTRALEKTPSGPVVYHPNRCLGCRYCMVSCPFDVPKYEYDSANPRVRKCTFCAERQAEGLEPACTSVCPTGALQFGKREALLAEARRRVYGQPDQYLPAIYGEHEAGGTSWLYIGDRTPQQLGLKADVPATPASALAQGALAVVPAVITLWPPLLMGLHAFSHRRDEATRQAGAGSEETHHG